MASLEMHCQFGACEASRLTAKCSMSETAALLTPGAVVQDLPKDVVFAKRLLGRSWSDPFIQKADHRLWSFTIIRSSWGKPLILGENGL